LVLRSVIMLGVLTSIKKESKVFSHLSLGAFAFFVRRFSGYRVDDRHRQRGRRGPDHDGVGRRRR
ncbi:hypothetical protein ABLO16_13605, partial [Mycobacterium tuberculosis]